MSHYCEVRPSPGKGKGIFAKREIPAGTRIMKEIMFFCAQNPLGHNREYDDPPTMRVSPFRIYKLYRELTAQSQKEYRGLSYTSLPDLDEVKESMKEDNGVIAQDTLPRMDFKLACKTAAIFQENALPLRNPGNPVLAVFDEMVSRINHSCVPNSQFHYSDYAYVYALKDIAAGEEIQISYASAIMERNTRRARLSQRYGFDCECPACDLDTAFGRESESRRERLCKLQNDIYALEKVEDGDDDLRKLGDMYVEMCNLLLDEGITGDERIQALSDTAGLFDRLGGSSQAHKFSAQAVEASVIAFGMTSGHAERFKEQLESIDENESPPGSPVRLAKASTLAKSGKRRTRFDQRP